MPDNLGGAILGMGIGAWNDARQIKQNERQQKQNLYYDTIWMNRQQKAALEMWEATGYKGQKRQLIEAGLNPGLMYGMGGGGGATTGPSAGRSGMGAPTDTGAIGMGIQAGIQAALAKATIENTKAQTDKTRVETEKIAETDTPNVEADTANKILQGIILKFGGQEAERQWNINKELSLEEYGAKSNELEQRKAAANTLAKLYEDGTMQKMTEAELENKIKDLGLKTEQIKGKKLENAILELEKNMQEKLGIDRGGPTWIKMIGRLILGLTGGQ